VTPGSWGGAEPPPRGGRPVSWMAPRPGWRWAQFCLDQVPVSRLAGCSRVKLVPLAALVVGGIWCFGCVPLSARSLRPISPAPARCRIRVTAPRRLRSGLARYVRQQPKLLRMATHVSLVDARDDASYCEWLTHVYSFYLHDLSQFAPHEYRLSARGQWEPDHLPYWLAHAFCHPLVLLEGEVPVGFAFVGQEPFPFMSDGVQFRLAEFFILRSRRRSGVGRSAARTTLTAFSGSFELVVLERNLPALAFWRSVLPEVATGPVREASSPEDVRFTFSTGAA